MLLDLLSSQKRSKGDIWYVNFELSIFKEIVLVFLTDYTLTDTVLGEKEKEQRMKPRKLLGIMPILA